jgi:hypothetical protein
MASLENKRNKAQNISVHTCFVGILNGGNQIISSANSTQPNQYRDWPWAGQLGFNFQQRQKFFPLASAMKWALGPIQPIQQVQGTISLGVKWPVAEANHSTPSSAKTKKD